MQRSQLRFTLEPWISVPSLGELQACRSEPLTISAFGADRRLHNDFSDAHDESATFVQRLASHALKPLDAGCRTSGHRFDHRRPEIQPHRAIVARQRIGMDRDLISLLYVA